MKILLVQISVSWLEKKLSEQYFASYVKVVGISKPMLYDHGQVVVIPNYFCANYYRGISYRLRKESFLIAVTLIIIECQMKTDSKFRPYSQWVLG